jgi:hypothetical protein
MNWEICKAYGVIQVNPRNNSISLYYDRFNHKNVPSPNLYMVIESAIWQGNSLIVRGVDQSGFQRVYIFNGFYDYQQIS